MKNTVVKIADGEELPAKHIRAYVNMKTQALARPGITPDPDPNVVQLAVRPKPGCTRCWSRGTHHEVLTNPETKKNESVPCFCSCVISQLKDWGRSISPRGTLRTERLGD